MNENRQKRVALIRADGSKTIGMGHLYRAILLAKMLRQRFKMTVKLLVRNDPAAVRFLYGRDLEIILLDVNLSLESEIDAINRAIINNDPALLIFDLLQQEEEPGYLPAIKRNGSLLIAITDDSGHREMPAQLVVNGNPNQIGQNYGDDQSQYLLGPQYFIIDPLNNAARAKRPAGQIMTILLTFGGSDHNNLIFKVLGALEHAPIQPKIKFKLAVSSACGYLDRLRDKLATSVLGSDLIVDALGFAALWPDVDLALTAGGNTLFERIAARLPGATICQLERQMEIADKFAAMGVNVNLGFGPDLTEDELARGLMRFVDDKAEHQRQYERAPEVIDGRGLVRLGDKITELLQGGVK